MQAPNRRRRQVGKLERAHACGLFSTGLFEGPHEQIDGGPKYLVKGFVEVPTKAGVLVIKQGEQASAAQPSGRQQDGYPEG